MLSTEPRHLVVIGGGGASCGALIQFFSPVCDSADLSFLVLAHGLPASDVVQLRDRLARSTSLPVRIGTPGEPLVAGFVYVSGRDAGISLHEGVWSACDRNQRYRQSAHDVDDILSSLAEYYGERLFGVILSGQGLDGVRGLQRVHACGGTVLVQSPESASEDGLLRAALVSVDADFVLEPKDLMLQCLALASRPEPDFGVLSTESGTAGQGGQGDIEEGSASHFCQLFDVLRSRTGADFSAYRRPTIERQIAKRMRLTGTANFVDYVDLLTADQEECEKLRCQCHIGVTSFFRDRDAFEILYRRCVRPLIENSSPGEDIRIWVPACSTGEEAYSIAMLFLEAEMAVGRRVQFKIFATDVDAQAVRKAASGGFDETQISTLPRRLRVKFFTKRDRHYIAAPFLRERIVFAVHDLLRSPPFRHMHLISCRNMLIYLESAGQTLVLKTLESSLRNEGFLFLGDSERCGESVKGFENLSERGRLYQKRKGARVLSAEEAMEQLARSKECALHLWSPKERRREREPSKPGATGRTHSISIEDSLRDRFVEPSLIASEDGRLLYSQGDVTAYLQFAPAEARQWVHSLIREEFRRAFDCLWAALKHSKATKPILVPSKAVGGGEALLLIGRRVSLSKAREPVFEISFLRESDLPEGIARPKLARDLEESLEAVNAEIGEREEQLEASLSILSHSKDELIRRNEELLSINEELYSVNEELRLANAELYGSNERRKVTIDEMTDSHGEWGKILRAAGLAYLGLDDQLRIRSFSQACKRYIHILDNDLGRPLEHLAFRCSCGCDPKLLHEILDTGKARQWQMPSGPASFTIVRAVPEGRLFDEPSRGVTLFFISSEMESEGV